MVGKNDCIRIFNAMIRGTPVSFVDDLLPLFENYLEERKIKKVSELISLVIQNPSLMQQAMPKLEEFYCSKFSIYKLQIRNSNSLVNNFNKTILYYE